MLQLGGRTLSSQAVAPPDYDQQSSNCSSGRRSVSDAESAHSDFSASDLSEHDPVSIYAERDVSYIYMFPTCNIKSILNCCIF